MRWYCAIKGFKEGDHSLMSDEAEETDTQLISLSV